MLIGAMLVVFFGWCYFIIYLVENYGRLLEKYRAQKEYKINFQAYQAEQQAYQTVQNTRRTLEQATTEVRAALARYNTPITVNHKGSASIYHSKDEAVAVCADILHKLPQDNYIEVKSPKNKYIEVVEFIAPPTTIVPPVAPVVQHRSWVQYVNFMWIWLIGGALVIWHFGTTINAIVFVLFVWSLYIASMRNFFYGLFVPGFAGPRSIGIFLNCLVIECFIADAGVVGPLQWAFQNSPFWTLLFLFTVATIDVVYGLWLRANPWMTQKLFPNWDDETALEADDQTARNAVSIAAGFAAGMAYHHLKDKDDEKNSIR